MVSFVAKIITHTLLLNVIRYMRKKADNREEYIRMRYAEREQEQESENDG